MTDNKPIGLPETLAFDAVFKTVFDYLIEGSYATLAADEPDTYLGWYGGNEEEAKDEYRTQLRSAIDATLMALGVDEPEGDSLDWLGHLYALIEPRLPTLYEWITEDEEA